MPTVARASRSSPGQQVADEAECGVERSARGAQRPGVASGTPRASNRTVTWLGAVTWPGATSANSSSRFCGFCTMPVTRRVVPSWRQRSPTLAEGGRHPAGHRYLARAGRVVPADQREHRLPNGRRVLRAQVEGVDRAGMAMRLVLDHLGPAEAVLQRRDLAGQMRIGAWKSARSGRAETRVRPAGGVLVETPPHDRGRDCRRDEPRTRSCWRHSRRNSRQAQRTTARRAARRRYRAPRRPGRYRRAVAHAVARA